MYSLLPSACLSVLLSIGLGQAYTVYDTNYEYEVGDTQAREEILITETPEILSLPQHLVVRRGQNVRLPCLVDRLEGYVLLWRKDDNIVSVGSQVLDSVSIIYILYYRSQCYTIVRWYISRRV